MSVFEDGLKDRIDLINERLDILNERLDVIQEIHEGTNENIVRVIEKMDDLIDAFKKTSQLIDVIDKCENNVTSLNRMINEFKGVVSMTRASLPSRCKG